MAKLELDQLIGGGTVELARRDEHPEERTARLRREEREHRLDQIKGITLFFVGLVVLLTLGGLAAWLGFFEPLASPDERRWAQTVLTILVSASTSFVIGRATKPA